MNNNPEIILVNNDNVEFFIKEFNYDNTPDIIELLTMHDGILDNYYYKDSFNNNYRGSYSILPDKNIQISLLNNKDNELFVIDDFINTTKEHFNKYNKLLIVLYNFSIVEENKYICTVNEFSSNTKSYFIQNKN